MTLILKGNYVDAPRKWNPKTSIACMIDRALGWPSAQPKVTYVGMLKEGQELRDLKLAVLNKYKEDIEAALKKYGHLFGDGIVTHPRRAAYRW